MFKFNKMPLKKEHINISINDFLQNINITEKKDTTVDDIILFTEPVFKGSYPNSKYSGERRILAKVLKENYGKLKGQHTFSLVVLDSDGYEPIPVGTKIRRLGRNVYKNEFYMLPLAQNEQRDEKHQRKEKAMQQKYYNWLSEAEAYLDEIDLAFTLNEKIKLLNKAKNKLDKVYNNYNDLNEGLKDFYNKTKNKFYEKNT
jgi:hypothetical protein